MASINTSAELKQAIAELEERRLQEKEALIEQFHLTREGLQPANLVKSLISDVAGSSEVKDMLINNTIGMASGFISKKLLLGAAPNPVKKLLGSVLQFGIGHLVANNPGALKEAGGRLLKSIFGKKKKEAEEPSDEEA